MMFLFVSVALHLFVFVWAVWANVKDPIVSKSPLGGTYINRQSVVWMIAGVVCVSSLGTFILKGW